MRLAASFPHLTNFSNLGGFRFTFYAREIPLIYLLYLELTHVTIYFLLEIIILSKNKYIP